MTKDVYADRFKCCGDGFVSTLTIDPKKKLTDKQRKKIIESYIDLIETTKKFTEKG